MTSIWQLWCFVNVESFLFFLCINAVSHSVGYRFKFCHSPFTHVHLLESSRSFKFLRVLDLVISKLCPSSGDDLIICNLQDWSCFWEGNIWTPSWWLLEKEASGRGRCKGVWCELKLADIILNFFTLVICDRWVKIQERVLSHLLSEKGLILFNICCSWYFLFIYFFWYQIQNGDAAVLDEVVPQYTCWLIRWILFICLIHRLKQNLFICITIFICWKVL